MNGGPEPGQWYVWAAGCGPAASCHDRRCVGPSPSSTTHLPSTHAAYSSTVIQTFDNCLSVCRMFNMKSYTGWMYQSVSPMLCLSDYKCLHGMGPPYLSETCLPISSLPGHRHLHSAARGELAVPRYRLTTAGRRAFSFAGPSAWNNLPTYLNDHTLNLDSFKRFLKFFLFHMYW